MDNSDQNTQLKTKEISLVPDGFYNSDDDITYEDEQLVCQNLTSLSQHNISDLINELTIILNKEGNLPIVYWDQDSACKFKKFTDFCSVNKQNDPVLLFGGFHVNGDGFRCIGSGP
jgi:hypothetical protein